MTTIVFSKDRALQLDAFLRSYRDHVTPLSDVQVLCAASSERHSDAYSDVFDRFKWAIPRVQVAPFKRELLSLLPKTGNVVFFVDDQVFTRAWTVEELPGLSLRLGVHLTMNYNSCDAPQPLPTFESWREGAFTWLWADGKMAWGYPLSLDGHVYEVDAIRTMIEGVDFTSPNTLEAALQPFTSYQKYGLCYNEARVVNVPWNTVQTDWKNRCADVADVDVMLAHWEAGKQIDLSGIYGVLNESVHQEFPLVLESR